MTLLTLASEVVGLVSMHPQTHGGLVVASKASLHTAEKNMSYGDPFSGSDLLCRSSTGIVRRNFGSDA